MRLYTPRSVPPGSATGKGLPPPLAPSAWCRAVSLALGLTLAQSVSAQMCEQPTPFVSAAPLQALGDDGRLQIEADRADWTRSGWSDLSGHVRLLHEDREFVANGIRYDQDSGALEVAEPSWFRNSSVVIQSGSAQFDLSERHGSFFDTQFTLPERAARGEAERIQLAADGRAQLYQPRYTSCGPRSDAWYIEAEEIRLDQDEGLGSAHNARLRFHGVPILWLPYLQFPIDDQRRSGLLYPTVGQSDRTGFDLAWPLYLNLLPNADATLTPRYMSDRGTQIGADGRYLLRRAEGTLAVQHLGYDETYDDSRTLFSARHQGLINQRLGVDANFTEVSDPEYFIDLGSDADTASISHLERHLRLTYQSPGAYRLQGMVQDWQSISSNLDGIDDPYIRLPQLLFDAQTGVSALQLRSGLNAELVNFARDGSIEGLRTDLQPYLRYEQDKTGWYFNAQTDLRYTAYRLTGTDPGIDDSLDRLLPIYSTEGGLRFERNTPSGAIQTLEPRGFALYVPYRDQTALPLFDTGEPDFGFVQLFERNRFTGADRQSDARHVAGSLSSRWLDPETGLSRWRVSVGQLFRFSAPRVSLPDVPPPSSGATEFVSELEYRFNAQWRTQLSNQWSPRDDRFDRGNIALDYSNPLRGERLNLRYRYQRDLLEQTDLSAAWPIGGNWRLAGRSRYSLRDDASLDSFAGLEYETCCWAFRASYRRYILNNADEYNSGVYFQLELKGLTRIGSGFDEFLPGNVNDRSTRISGY